MKMKYIKVGDYLFCIKRYKFDNDTIDFYVGEKCKVITKWISGITIGKAKDYAYGIPFSLVGVHLYFETVEEHRKKLIASIL